MNIIRYVLISLFGTCYVLSSAQQLDRVQRLDEVVITDTRFELKKENSGKTVIKITTEELDRKKGQTLAQIINTKSGITINGSRSNAGQNLATYIRGGQNRQVLILIDGIAVGDPSHIENNFDLNSIALDQIESLEILKGAASVLYGNRASTAVINITLKKGGTKLIGATFSSFVGTNNSLDKIRLDITNFTNAVSIRGRLKKINYIANFSNRYTDGLSAIETDEAKSDVFSKFNFYTFFGYKFSNNIEISTFFNFDKYSAGYDNSFTFSDADNRTINEQYRFGVNSNIKYNKGSLEIKLAYLKNEREFEESFPAIFNSEALVLDSVGKYKFSENLLAILGLNIVSNNMDSYNKPFGGSHFVNNISKHIAKDYIIDPFFNITYLSKFGLNFNTGIRLNNHSEYGNHLVYNLNPSYSFGREPYKLKVLASVSSAYITPSLFQLFSPEFGNSNLQPQSDVTTEIGMEMELGNKINVSGIYFNRRQSDFIEYVFQDLISFEGYYLNLERDFRVHGIELKMSLKPISSIKFSSNYTFTESTDLRLYRIPKHKLNAELQINTKTNQNFSLHYQYNDKRTSPFLNDAFTTNRVLKPYALVDLYYNQEILNKRLRVFASVSNILNTNYSELYNYSTKGRNFKIGFNLEF